MSTRSEALRFFETEIEKREKREILTFDQYLNLLQSEPERILRNIFQLFYDMVKTYVGEGEDEYPDDPESIGFVQYDCSKLFADGADNPFFADRLFANRFVGQIESLRQGFQQNRIYAYDGPSGCGKSTFLNNLLRTFEAYTEKREGQTFEIVWEIDENLFLQQGAGSQKLVIPCPSHDCPILIIPKDYRVGFLERLLPDPEIKERIFSEKQYEWIFTGGVCTICRSIFWAAFDALHSLEKVLQLINVKICKFDRHMGEGISIFNPGDRPIFGIMDGRPVGGYFGNKQAQEGLDRIFSANSLRYVFSHLAKTNNGIYVLMDVKSHNRERLIELHNVISEGVHKVGEIEEPINSLFFALMNPEDKSVIEEEKMESLKGRIQYNKIPYVLEPATEIKILKSIFGETIDKAFLPHILESFVKVIVASRMNQECKPLKEWIANVKSYGRYCDENGLLLRMEIYSGVIPDWLSEDDRKKFTAPIRRALIAEGENEGNKGFSGRDSLQRFREFFSRYSGRTNLINMDNLMDFFKDHIPKDIRDANLPPKGFLEALRNSYDYTVLNEVKDSLYSYNEAQIEKDILHYLWAVDYDIDTKVKCRYTGEEIEVTRDFLKRMATHLSIRKLAQGQQLSEQDAVKFAAEIQKKSLVMRSREGADIKETDLYRELFVVYKNNLRERALQPYIDLKSNFRTAVKAFGTKEFETFETGLKKHVAHMFDTLMDKFGYTEQGVKEICLYVIDKNLAQKFA